MMARLHTVYKSWWPDYIQFMKHDGQIKSIQGIGNTMMYRVKSAMIRTLLIAKIMMIILWLSAELTTHPSPGLNRTALDFNIVKCDISGICQVKTWFYDLTDISVEFQNAIDCTLVASPSIYSFLNHMTTRNESNVATFTDNFNSNFNSHNKN